QAGSAGLTGVGIDGEGDVADDKGVVGTALVEIARRGQRNRHRTAKALLGGQTVECGLRPLPDLRRWMQGKNSEVMACAIDITNGDQGLDKLDSRGEEGRIDSQRSPEQRRSEAMVARG